MEWTFWGSGFRDHKNRRKMLDTAGVVLGIIAGRALARYMGMTVPETLLRIALTVAAFFLALRMLKMVVRRSHTIIAPKEGDQFTIEFPDEAQVVWKSEMADGSIEDLPLYQGDFQVIKGGRFYILCGVPNAEFARKAKAEERRMTDESCYAVTKLSVFLRKDLVENTEIAALLAKKVAE